MVTLPVTPSLLQRTKHHQKLSESKVQSKVDSSLVQNVNVIESEETGIELEIKNSDNKVESILLC